MVLFKGAVNYNRKEGYYPSVHPSICVGVCVCLSARVCVHMSVSPSPRTKGLLLQRYPKALLVRLNEPYPAPYPQPHFYLSLSLSPSNSWLILTIPPPPPCFPEPLLPPSSSFGLQPLLSTSHLIHSRQYWFSAWKIKKAMNFNAQLSVRLSPSHLATLTLFSPFPILLVLIFAFSLCMLSLMYLSFPLSLPLFFTLSPNTPGTILLLIPFPGGNDRCRWK